MVAVSLAGCGWRRGAAAAVPLSRVRARRQRCSFTRHAALARAPHGAPQPTVKLLINGEFVDSKTSKWVDVVCPVSAARGAGSSGRLVGA